MVHYWATPENSLPLFGDLFTKKKNDLKLSINLIDIETK